jgi:hypothetical protein
LNTPSPSEPCADACTASAKRPVKARRMPFPELPKTGDGTGFWLPAWTRETAKLEALMAFSRLLSTQKACDKSEPLYLAMISSEIKLKESADMSLEQLKHMGGLMFAFPESTKLTLGGAAC